MNDNDYMKKRLADLEKYPEEYERMLQRIIEGDSFRQVCQQYVLGEKRFMEWICADELRLKKYGAAKLTYEQLALEKKRQTRKERAMWKDVFALAQHIRQVPVAVWQEAGRYLKMDLPPRPQDLP